MGTQFDQSRKFGIEIEMMSPIDGRSLAAALTNAGINTTFAGYTHSTTRHWKVVTDGSLSSHRRGYSGYEVVSPPLSGQDGLDEVALVMDVLVDLNCDINKSCGLHVHHDASDLTRRQLINVGALYKQFEETIDELVAPSRRGNNNSFCRSMNSVSWDDLQSRTNTRYNISLYTRYYKLNFDAFVRHGTLEFRQHQGTLNASKAINWIVFTQAMVTTGKNHNTRLQDRGLTHYSKLGQALRLLPCQDPCPTMAGAYEFMKQRRQELARA